MRSMNWIIYDRDGQVLRVTKDKTVPGPGEFLYLVAKVPDGGFENKQVRFRGAHPVGLEPIQTRTSSLRQNPIRKILWRDDTLEQKRSLQIVGYENMKALNSIGIETWLTTPEAEQDMSHACLIYQMRSRCAQLRDREAPRVCGFFVVDCDRVPYSYVRDLNKLDHVFVPSQFARDVCVISGVTVPITIWRHGVDLETFQDQDRTGPDHPCRFLYVGDCIDRKAVDILLDAFSRSIRSGTEATLTIKTIDCPSWVPVMIKELGLDSVVTVFDKKLTRIELNDLYRSHDVLSFATRGEAFGMPALEAMATGMPVIYTDFGGTKEFAVGYQVHTRPVPDRQEHWNGSEPVGRWFEPDQEELSLTINEAAVNVLDRALLGMEARRKAETMSWVEVTRCIAPVFATMTGR